MERTEVWKFDEINVVELLPQVEPFVFVHKMLDFNTETKSCTTKFTVLPSTLLTENGKLTESGLIENIAQTCAVHIGIYNKYILKREIQVGFIGAVKNLSIFDQPLIGEILTTTITIKTEFGSMKIADAQVFKDQILVAEGELKIALQE